MSGYSFTQAELMYSSYGAATTSVPAAAAATITAALPVMVIPAKYFKSVGELSSSLRLEIGGQCTMTATFPTWQFGLYAVLLATPPAFGTSLTIGTTGSFTPGQAATNATWEGIINIGLRTLAPGAASTIVAFGRFMSDAFLPAAYSVTQQTFVSMPATGTYTPLATYDTNQAYSLWPGLVLGAATAGNTVTVNYCKLFGEN